VTRACRVCRVNFVGFGYHEEGVICMSMHEEKPLVLTGSHDKTAKLVSYATAKVLPPPP